jgi:hypothetical protein
VVVHPVVDALLVGTLPVPPFLGGQHQHRPVHHTPILAEWPP